MSQEELAKQYSEKWGVSLEEAKKQVKQLLERKPGDRSKVVPSKDMPFPEPVGPLSEKVQDMGQAALSTAYLGKALKEINQPPEEMERLKSEMGTVKETVNNVMELVTKRLEELQDTLDEKVKKEERAALISELEEKVVKPLKSDLEAVKKRVEAAPEGEPAKTAEGLREIRTRLKEAEEDAKGVLEDMGYSLPSKRLELGDEGSVPMKDGDLVAELKGRGYRVEYDMIPREQALKLADEARKGAEDDYLEDKRIQAVENIIRDAMKNIFDMFKEPLQRWMETSMTTPREPQPGNQEAAEKSRPKEQSASQGS